MEERERQKRESQSEGSGRQPGWAQADISVIAFIMGCSGLVMEELAGWPGVALCRLVPADTCHLGFQGAKLSPLTHG